MYLRVSTNNWRVHEERYEPWKWDQSGPNEPPIAARILFNLHSRSPISVDGKKVILGPSAGALLVPENLKPEVYFPGLDDRNAISFLVMLSWVRTELLDLNRRLGVTLDIASAEEQLRITQGKIIDPVILKVFQDVGRLVWYIRDGGDDPIAKVALDQSWNFARDRFLLQMTARFLHDETLLGSSRIDPDQQQRIYAACEMVMDTFPAVLDVNAMAQQAMMSRRTFFDAFRVTMGCTPLRWLQRLRLETALGLLQNTQLNMRVIAERSGFASENGLYRFIRREMGVSPSELRSRTISLPIL